MSALPDNKILTIQEAAKILDVSTKTLRRWEARGVLMPHRTAGKHRRYLLDDIYSFIEEKKAKASHIALQAAVPSPVITPTTDVVVKPSPVRTSKALPRPVDELHTAQSQINYPTLKLPTLPSFPKVNFTKPPRRVAYAATAAFVLILIAAGSARMVNHSKLDNEAKNKVRLAHTDLSSVLAESAILQDLEFNVYVPTNLRNDVKIEGDSLSVGTGSPTIIDLLGGDTFVTGDLEVGGVIYGDGSGLTNIPTYGGWDYAIGGVSQNTIASGDTLNLTAGTGFTITGTNENELKFSLADSVSLLGQSIESSEITDGTINKADLNSSNSATNGYALTYNSSTGGFTWIDLGSGIVSAWTDNGTLVSLTTTTDSVSIGGTTDLAKLTVDGDIDEVQLLIQGNGTQTANLAVFEQSDGTDVVTVDNSGNLTLASGADLTIGSIALSDSAAGAAGASLIGVDNANISQTSATILQDILEDLSASIGSGSSKWTYNGNIIHPATPANYSLAIGGTDATAPFYVDRTTGDTTIEGVITTGSSSIGLTTAAGYLDADAIQLIGTNNSATSSGSGLVVNSDQIGLLQGCSDGEVLKWNDSNSAWECATDTGASFAVVNIQNNDASIGTNVDTVDFNNFFSVTASPSSEANVAINFSNPLTGDYSLAANEALFGQSGLIFEGSTANAAETYFAVTDPTADRTITFQDGSGTVAFLSDIISSAYGYWTLSDGTNTANIDGAETVQVSGTGITVTVNEASPNTLSLVAADSSATNELQNLFSSIAVSGQPIVTADSQTQTLNLAEGSNVSITTNNTSKTITINATDTNTTYSSGNDLDLTGTTFDIEPTLNFVQTITRNGGNLTLSTTTSGDVNISSAGNVSFSDSKVTIPIAFSDSDTSLDTTAQAIVDAINEVYGLATATGAWSRNTTDGVLYPTISADDLALGGSTAGTATFFVDAATGAITIDGQVTSTVSTGTAPFIVASTTVVSNLNADLLDGQSGSFYQNADNINAGTLSTDRYSAYADLGAEGYLDNNAGTDILLQSQGDARYLGFRTLTTASGTSPVADQYNDTLTLAAGSDISITGNSSTDTVTIAFTGSYDNYGNWILSSDSNGAFSGTIGSGQTASIVGGAGISTSLTADRTLSIAAADASASNELQNLFSSVAVSGQPTVTAGSQTETLNLAAGSNVTITTNNTSKTVTIAATDTNTTYSAGNDLDLTGTTFDIEPTLNFVQTITRDGGNLTLSTTTSGDVNISAAGTINFSDTRVTTPIPLSTSDTGLDTTAQAIVDAINEVYGLATATGAWSRNTTDGVLYPTISTDDLALGGSTAGTATFFVDAATGAITIDGQLTSTVSTGTAPFIVASTTVVSNLNADLLDGQSGSFYQDASNMNAGTLSTDRYSAYTDLTAEGYLDNNAGTDILLQSQGDARYLGFRTLTTSSGSAPVADLYNDNLTINGGTDISVTGDSSTDTITIAFTGSYDNYGNWILSSDSNGAFSGNVGSGQTASIVGGAGISTSLTADRTLSIAAADTSATNELQNLFSTINVPTGTDPVASSNTDTLNIAITGSNLTLNGGASNTITFDISESTLAGVGLVATGDALDFSSTELNALTWGDSSQANFTWSFALSGATDPSISFANNAITLTAGTFTASGDATIQGGDLTLGQNGADGTLTLYSELGATDYSVVLQPSGSQSQTTTYTLPPAYAAGNDYALVSSTSGILEWKQLTGVGGVGDITSIVAGDGLTTPDGSSGDVTVNAVGGLGIIANADDLQVDVLDSADGTSGVTSSYSGLEFQGTGSDELTLLQGCSDGQVLAWDNTNTVWACTDIAGVGGVGDITAVGSVTSGAAFTETTGNDGNTLHFEGTTVDNNELHLVAADVANDTTTVTLPAITGELASLAGSQTFTGAKTIADDVALSFGTGNDFGQIFDSTNNLLSLQTAATASTNIDYALYTFSTDTANTGLTANQEVFEIGKGGADDSEANFVELLALDEDGDLNIAGNLTVAGLSDGYIQSTSGLLSSTAAIPWPDISSQPNIVSSVDGVTNDEGNIDLVAGADISVTPDDSANTVTIAFTGSYDNYSSWTLSSDSNGAFSGAVGSGQTATVNGGNGIATSLTADRTLSVATDLLTSQDSTSGVSSSFSGLEFQGTGSDKLTLLQGCSDGQVLKWNESVGTWGCSNDTGATSAIINVQNNTTPVGTNVDTLNFSTDFLVNANVDPNRADVSIADDIIDFTEIKDGLTLDADTSIAAGAGLELTYNKTLTDATSETGFVMNFTARDTTSSTTAQYGLYLDNLASSEGLDASLVIDNSDLDDAVGAAIKFINAGGGFTNILDINGTLLSAAELSLLDGRSGTLLDTNNVTTQLSGWDQNAADDYGGWNLNVDSNPDDTIASGEAVNIDGGSGITLTYTAASNTLNIAAVDTSASNELQNLFSSIAVSGQPIVTADSQTQTLNLAEGSNVTITTDNTSKTVTIAATDTNTTYSAGNDLDLTGTTFDIESTLNFVQTITRDGGNLALSTTTSGDVDLSSAGEIHFSDARVSTPIAFSASDTGLDTTAQAIVDAINEVYGLATATGAWSRNTTDGVLYPTTSTDDLALGGSTSGTASFFVDAATGAVTIDGQLTSTVATGTSPFVVTSTTVVSNLNADLLDGQSGSFYQDASNMNAGTLSTDRYSAYTDLTAEGYLDNNAGTDILLQSQGDARYLGFRTINASSGTDPVANLYNDTLNVTGGTDISVTGDSSTDTITIAFTGSYDNYGNWILSSDSNGAFSGNVGSGQTASIVGGAGISTSLTADRILSIAAADTSATNEIQNIFATIANGSGVTQITPTTSSTALQVVGSGATSVAYDDINKKITISSTDTNSGGTITEVVAGTGITGGGNSGSVTVNAVGGVGITANADDLAFDATELNDLTWGNNTDSSMVWGFNTSGSTDPSIAFADNTITLTGNVVPDTADTYNLGSATAEWNSLYLGDDSGLFLGADQDWSIAYDETTDDRLEFNTTGATGVQFSNTGTQSLTSDFFNINIGANYSTTGNIFSISDNGSVLFSVSESQITNALPTAFTGAGDVTMAYDLQFTNQTSSYIKSNATLYLQAGESFESNDLVLQTYNAGEVSIYNSTNGTLASFGSDITFTSPDDIIFDDAQLTSSIQLTEVDTTLPNSNTGIVDAINDAYNLANSGTGTMSSFNTAADTGTGSITNAETLTINGGNDGLDATLSGDTFTLAFDANEVDGNKTWGAASVASDPFTWTFAVTNSGTNPSITFADNALTLTANSVTLSGLNGTAGIVLNNASGVLNSTQTIGSNYITDDSLTTDDLAATLTFDNGDLIDLSAMINDGASKGLKLPSTANASLVSPGSAGFLAYDTTNNKVIYFDGSNWTEIGTGGSGTMSSFILSGDNTDANQTIEDGETLDIEGGTNGIDTVISATNLVTINFDTTEVSGNKTWGSAATPYTWTFDSSATTDPAITFGDNALTFTAGTSTFSGSVLPGTADSLNLGSTSAEWNALYLGDDAGLYLGNDQDWSIAYDETTDDRLEFNTTGATGIQFSNTGTQSLTSDFFNINIGANYSTTGNIFSISDNGSVLFSVSESQITNNLPASFNASGDVTFAYDILMSNQTASFIKSLGPITIETGESFENNDLTLKTYGTGDLVADIGGNLVIGSDDPAIVFDTATATDTDFWAGIIENANSTDDDTFQIGKGTTVGTTPYLTLNKDGLLGIGVTPSGAYLDLAAATTSNASLNVTTGVAPSVPTAGDIYSNGTNLYYYNGATWDDLTDTGTGGTVTSSGSDTYIPVFSGSGTALANSWINQTAASSTLNIATAQTITASSVTALNLGAATVDFNGAGTLQYGDASNFTIADDGSHNIFALNGTTNALSFGNATDNNTFNFLGTGATTFGGNVDIAGTLAVGTSDGFTIDATGNITKIGNVAHGIADASGDLQLSSNSSNISLNDSITVAGDLAVNGATSADITSTTTTASLFNSTVTTLNIGGETTALNLGDASGLTVTPGGDVNFALANTKGITFTSDLSGGNRTAPLISIAQANDATYAFDAANTGYLSIVNNDADSGTSLLYLNQNGDGTALWVSGPFAGRAIVTSIGAQGTGIAFTALGDLNSGKVIDLGNSSSSSGALSAFTGDLISTAFYREYTGASTLTDTGNYLDLSRDNRVNNAGGTYNITGDLAKLSSSLTETSGTITDSSNILSLAQNCGTNADCTGAVLEITNAGTGNAIDILGTGTRAINSTSGNLTFKTTTSGDLIFDSAANITFTDFTGSGSGCNLTTDSSGVLTCGTDANSGGTVTGNGTENFLSRWDATGTNLVDAGLSDDGTTLSLVANRDFVIPVGTGQVGIGSAVNSDYLVNVDATATNDFSVALNIVQANNADATVSGIYTNVSGATTTNYGGYFTVSGAINNTGIAANASKTDSTAGITRGGRFEAVNYGAVSTDIDDTYGIYSSVERIDATGGTINTYGNYINIGPIDNAGAGNHSLYGLYIDTVAGADTNWAIYSAGGNSYFNGGIELDGTLQADGTLDANGQVDLGDGGDAIIINGNALTLQTTGVGSDITLNAVDQIVLTDFADCSALETVSGVLTCGTDADTDTTYGFNNGLTNDAGTVQLGGSLVEATTLTLGTNQLTFNLDDTGDFVIQDAGTAFATFADDGAITLGKSAAASTINIATGTAADTINIGTGDTNADDINIGGLATSTIGLFGVTSIGDGGTTNYAQFNATGDLTFNGTADTITGPSAATLNILAGASQALTLTGNASSVWSTTAGDLTVDSATGSLNLTSGENVADSIVISSDAGGIDITTASTEDIDITGTGGVNISSSEVAANAVSLTASGGTSATLSLNSNGTSAAAIDINATGTGGGIDMDTSDGAIALTAAGATNGVFTLTSAAAGSTTAFSFVGDSVNTGTGLDVSLDALTSGTGVNIASASNTLANGKLFNLTSSSTGITTGNMLSSTLTGASAFTGNLNLFEYTGATTATGDLVRINIGLNSNVGNLLNITDNGSTLFSVSESKITNALPTEFTAPGDVSIAYDLQFTNQTASYIKSKAPLYIEAGETFESNDLTLRTYNAGDVVLDLSGTGKALIGNSTDYLQIGNAGDLTFVDADGAASIIGPNGGSLTISAANSQNLDLTTATAGDISLDPAGAGDITIATDYSATSYLTVTGLTSGTGSALCLDGSNHLITCTTGTGGASGSGTGGTLPVWSGAGASSTLTDSWISQNSGTGTLSFSSSATTLSATSTTAVNLGAATIDLNGGGTIQTTGAGSDLTINAVDQIILTDFANCSALETVSGVLTCGTDSEGTAGFWTAGTNGIYENSDSIIVGTDAAFSYVSTPAGGDLKIEDDFEALGDGFVGGSLNVVAGNLRVGTGGTPDLTLDGEDTYIEGTLEVDGASRFDGVVGLGQNASGTRIDIAANTTALSSLRLNPSSAVNVTSPAIGDIWFNGTNLNFRKDGSTTVDLLGFDNYSSWTLSDGSATTSITSGATAAFTGGTGITAANSAGTIDFDFNSQELNGLTWGTGALASFDWIFDVSGTDTTLTFGSGSMTYSGDLLINGNTTLGNASGDTITFNASTLAIPNSLNIDSNTLFIDATTNRVGIGTNTPQSALDIAGASSVISNSIGDITITPTGNLILSQGNFGVGVASPTGALLDIAAATTSLSQIHLTSSAGTNKSTPAAGDLWFNGTNLNFYNGSTTTDLLAGGTTYTFSNGLTESSGAVTLGGSLTGATTITNGTASDFSVDLTSTGDFLVKDSGTAIATFADTGAITFAPTSGTNFAVTTAGAGAQTYTSGASTTTAFSFLGDSVSSGTGFDLSLDALAGGKGVNLTSTSTGITSGNVFNSAVSGASAFTGALNLFEYTGAATATGDVLRVHIGSSSNVGYLLNLVDDTTSLFNVSETAVTSNIPVNFQAAGDVSVAYDMVFTNQTASYIKSYGPITLEAGESFENNNLTLKTYGTGDLVFDNDGATIASINDDGTIYAGTFTSSGTAALCWDNSGGSTINDCSGTPVADYAEIYPTEADVNYGEIVVVGANSTTVDVFETDKNGNVLPTTQKEISKLAKASIPYQGTILGVTTQNYSDFSSTGHNTVNENDNPKAVAMIGRVKVFVDPSSETIQPGDYITSSAIAGKAQKATQSGMVVGQALESWDAASGKQTVMVFVRPMYYYYDALANSALDATTTPSTDPLAATTSGTEQYFSTDETGNSALNVDKIMTTDLTILGQTILADTTITGDLNVGTLTFDGIANSIDAIGDLKIQPKALGNVEIMGGKVAIDTDGNITATSITVEKVKVAGASAGTETLPAGTKTITISSDQVTSGSLIFVTAKTSIAYPLAVTSKVNGVSFTVELPAALSKDVVFDWMIVDHVQN